MTRTLYLPALLAALCISPQLNAQVAQATHCVYREGDDPQWARPDYDDSGWQKAPPNLLYQRPVSRILWQRCRIRPPQSSEPLFLQIRSLHAWRAYADGIPAGSFGDSETGSATAESTQRRALPPTLGPGPSYSIAVRLTNGNRNWRIDGPDLGTERALDLKRLRNIQDTLASTWLPLAAAPLILGAALVLLLLSGADPRRRAAFWFAIVAGSFALLRLMDGINTLEMPVDSRIVAVLALLGNIGLGFSPFLFYAFREKAVPRLFRAIIAIICVENLFFLLSCMPGKETFLLYAWLGASAPARALTLSLFVSTFASVWVAFWPWWRVGRRDLPLFAVSIIWMLAVSVSPLVQFPWIGNLLLLPLARQLHSATILPVMLTFTVILASRFRRVQVERDDLTLEMQAARAVQRMLVPERPEPVPGFAIDAAYLPSKEVSGDFYQLLPAADGSLLVVVGDVSGKGLEAGMVGAAVVGALGDLASRRPADVLTHLNRALMDKTRGGFVTCGCALFRADGSVEISNAGHVPPYLNGCESEVPHGPPLGIFGDAEYECAVLSPGSGTITYVSDGVVEAANASGELFGFERTRQISGKSAVEIAEAARAWGQNDDITVLTVAALEVRNA